MMSVRKARFFGLAMAAVLAGILVFMSGFTANVTPVRAQGGEFDLPPGVTWDEVNQIAHQMQCDVCEGIPLDECESVACRQWREEIARQLGEGRTEDQIIDYFVENFGAEVATLPRSTADRLLSYSVPVVLALIMGVIGGYQVWSMRQRGHQAGQPVRARRSQARQARPVPDDVDPALLDRLMEDLERS